jgi:Flp pilus assembly protein TadG
MRRIGQKELTEGVALVEFALLLPLFVVLMVGILEFAQVLFMQVALQHAVTFASRCASEFATADSLGSTNTPTDCSSSANIATYASQQAFGVSIPSSTFTVSTPANQYSPTQIFNCVYASYPEHFTIPFMPAIAITLTANSCYGTATYNSTR